MSKRTPRKITRLIFVWNADFSLAGGLNALKEVASGHHTCTLCAIAYHRVRQTSEWKGYKKELAALLGAEIREPCRNQLRAGDLAAAGDTFPAVLARTSKGTVILLSREQIDACEGEFAPFRRKLDAAIRKLTKGQSG